MKKCPNIDARAVIGSVWLVFFIRPTEIEIFGF